MRKAGGHDGGIEVKLEPIIFRSRVCGNANRREIEAKVAESLVAGKSSGNREHVRGGESFSLGNLAREQKFADTRNSCSGTRIVAVANLTVPDRFLIQLNALNGGIAEDHSAQTSIAYGKCIGPFGGWLTEVEFVWRRLLRRGDRERPCPAPCQCGSESGGSSNEAAARGTNGHGHRYLLK